MKYVILMKSKKESMHDRLKRKYGITEFYKTSPEHSVTSIGWSPKDQKWYGWSHRAIYGFGVGDIVKEGSVCAEYLPVGFKAKNLKDAKKMATAFARSVS